MPPGARNELPVWIQWLSLSALWTVWLAAAGFVWSKAKYNEANNLRFEHEPVIVSILLFGMPTPLVVLGLLFVLRLFRHRDWKPDHNLAFPVIAMLTGFGILLVLIGLLWPVPRGFWE